MERVQKKEEQKRATGQAMSPIQMATLVGNQAAQTKVTIQRAMPRMYRGDHIYEINHELHHIIPNSVLVGCINDFMHQPNLLENISTALEGYYYKISLPVAMNQHPNQRLPAHGGNHPVYNTEVENRIAIKFGTQGQLVADYLVNGAGPDTAIRRLAVQLIEDIHNLGPNKTLDDI